KVISRTSTQHFKSAPENLPQIAKQLGVMHVVEGSVQKAGDQVRVNVQLINALNDAHLWAETYDRRLIDIFSVETEIAKTIAESLQAKLTRSEQNSIAKAHASLGLLDTLDLRLERAVTHLERAVQLKPNYATAHHWLGLGHLSLGHFDQAIAEGKRAAELDPLSVIINADLAWTYA